MNLMCITVNDLFEKPYKNKQLNDVVFLANNGCVYDEYGLIIRDLTFAIKFNSLITKAIQKCTITSERSVESVLSDETTLHKLHEAIFSSRYFGLSSVVLHMQVPRPLAKNILTTLISINVVKRTQHQYKLVNAIREELCEFYRFKLFVLKSTKITT